MHSLIFEALRSGRTVLTANLRLARQVKADFNARQQSRGRSVWPTPDVLTWSAWLQRCWSESLSLAYEGSGEPPRLLLNALQEQALWEGIIEADLQDRALLQVPAMAETAREAWQLLHDWKIPLSDLSEPMSADGRAFKGWATRFAEICDLGHYLDTARLAGWVSAAVNARQLPAPDKLVVFGFDDSAPQQEEVLAALQEAGCTVAGVEPEPGQGQVRRMGFPDAEAELAAAAGWARRLLDEQGALRIGLVVHNLGGIRHRIARVLDDVLVPETVLPDRAGMARPYNISLGRPLSDYPLVRTAFLILEMARGALQIDAVGALLRSPFLAGAEGEMTQRSLLDAELRRLGALRMGVGGLAAHARGRNGAGGAEAHACPVLAMQLERWRDIRRSIPKSESPGGWGRIIDRLLQALGWPGERPLDSPEYQTVQAWAALLQELSTLNAVTPALSFDRVLARLRRLAAERIFQPESGDVPVQVLGTLEAAGAEFDRLWVMGLHDEVWPAPPRPNPLLPFHLQRRRGFPHASAAREYAFASRLTQRLLASAPDVIVSWSLREGDRDLRPSPLISQIDPAAPAYLPSKPVPYATVIQQARSLELLEDVWGPPVPTAEPMRGGSAIFQKQAACPFRAFVELRLGARGVKTVSIGLDPRVRGGLVHEVLEAVWKILKTHAGLARRDDETLGQLVRECAAGAVRDRARQYRDTFTEKFTALERQRLETLVFNWLALERDREPAIGVMTEEKREFILGGIACELRVDRIDKLADGRRLIIDYKTGITSVGSWFGERPDEPQLPLYALSESAAPAGLLFAQVRPGEMGYRGLTAEALRIPGARRFADTRYAGEADSWNGLLEHWRKKLATLGEAYRAGWAAVDPKDPPRTCRYCEQAVLCRIHELMSLDPAGAHEGERLG